MERERERVGEIIESATTHFTVGAYTLLEAPQFGALVRANTRTIGMVVYGLVYDISTGSKEPGGRAFVRGRTYSGESLYDEEIYREHPDLAEVLQTTFAAVTVGFAHNGQTSHYLPPHPPPVHYSVYECDTDELVRFTESCNFFRRVLASTMVPSEELLAATIRTAARVRPDGRAYLVRAGRELAALLKGEYDRLAALLQLVRPEASHQR